jgi:hypothetical protein
MGMRAGFKAMRTPRERALMKLHLKAGAIAVVIFTTLCLTLSFTHVGELLWKFNPPLFIAVCVAVMVAYVGFIFAATFRFSREMRKIRIEQQQASGSMDPANHQSGWIGPSAWSVWGMTPWEYRSPTTLFGLPLVHFTAGRNMEGKAKPAIGWIASGERAYGILFAGGAFAVGGIACGGASVGLLSFGGLSVGLLLAFGGFALGGVAMAGCAVGWIATGGLAIAWHAAMGGVGAAHDIAFAGAPLAAHANDAVARAFILNHPWLNIDRPMTRNVFWLACFLPMMIQMVAVSWWRRRVMKRAKLG